MIVIAQAVLILFVFIAQSTVLGYLSIKDTQPDLILLISVYSGLSGGKTRGATIGLITGFIQDTMSMGILGVNTFAKGFIGYVLGTLRGKVLSDNSLTQSCSIFVSSLFNGFFFLFLSTVLLQFEIKKELHLQHIVYQTIYNTLFGYVLFFCISKLKKIRNNLGRHHRSAH